MHTHVIKDVVVEAETGSPFELSMVIRALIRKGFDFHLGNIEFIDENNNVDNVDNTLSL